MLGIFRGALLTTRSSTDVSSFISNSNVLAQFTNDHGFLRTPLRMGIGLHVSWADSGSMKIEYFPCVIHAIPLTSSSLTAWAQLIGPNGHMLPSSWNQTETSTRKVSRDGTFPSNLEDVQMRVLLVFSSSFPLQLSTPAVFYSTSLSHSFDTLNRSSWGAYSPSLLS